MSERSSKKYVAQVRDINDYRIFVATWNLARKSPTSFLNLEDWLHTSPLADIYVLSGIVKKLQNLHPEGINNTVADVHDQHGDTRLDVDNTSC
nr:type I inositol polyphosphate 5-phosphatase 4-like [Tanacetum cinerariifolium]